MKYILSQFKIKDGKKADAEKFLTNLHKNHQIEMKNVLEESGVTLDCSFIEGEYLFIFKKLEDLDALKNNIESSKLEIYKEIRNWAEECLEDRKDTEAIAVFE